MSKFGWCLSGHHGECPASMPRNPNILESTGGLAMCSCDCHEAQK